ncbi:hypothetical protein ACH42_16270 [Endozoicomonas sp. (ex Bugula neritina AB1)]|nr:hypothetical protein ACH42_16270 [Endozoicomonas sp. (ex Bugula neritina AB1)]
MAELLYKSDFYSWTKQQAQLIRSGKMEELDLENILEELEGMGKSEHRALSSRLDVLLMHLLKWQYQPEHQSSGWKGSIKEQRFRIAKLLRDNPGLKPEIDDIMVDAYELAKISAYKETGLGEEMFPKTCPWSFDDSMSSGFWPE